MVLMTIGHAAYFIGKIYHQEFWNTLSLSLEISPWFYIRTITYIGAPGFFFLMGISISLLTASRLKSKWSHAHINKFLATRGLFLAIIATLLITPVWMPKLLIQNFTAHPIFILYFGVLSSLGICMIIASLTNRLDKKTLLPIALLGIIIPYIYVNSLPVFHVPNHLISVLMIPCSSSHLSVFYPIFPWLSICLFGAIWGKYYLEGKRDIFKITRNVGILLLILFVVSRLINIGNFHSVNINTITSFFALIKYPASISYILFTMGINLILLSALSKIKTISAKNPLIIFGKAPLFFYITHLYLFLLLGLFFPTGASLLATYAIWAIALIILYYLSSMYAKFKFKKGINSIWRFF